MGLLHHRIMFLNNQLYNRFKHLLLTLLLLNITGRNQNRTFVDRINRYRINRPRINRSRINRSGISRSGITRSRITRSRINRSRRNRSRIINFEKMMIEASRIINLIKENLRNIEKCVHFNEH